MENSLFDLKVKELKALGVEHTIYDNILILTQNMFVLGCTWCYKQEATSTGAGYEIQKGPLVNYYEKYKDNCTLPTEIANKCWLCPHCGRLFEELLPNIEFLGVKNVSI